jgi:hypothetical protein
MMRSGLWFGFVLFLFGTACGSGDDDASANTTGGTGGQALGGSGGSAAAQGGGAGLASGGTGQAGTSAGSAGTSGAGASLDYPSDTSQDGIKAFIDAMNYRSASWASGMSGPTDPPMGTLSPHGHEYIWYNHALRQSKADGHAGTVTDPFGVNSMAVKEIYTGSTVIGHAAMLRTDKNWTMFCTASESDRCYAGYVAGNIAYSTGIGNCGCHGGGTIVTAPMVPAP